MQKLYTPEGEALRGQPWPEYPRPLLQRDSFYNLNGEWEFAAQGAALSTIACFVVIPVLMLIL